MAILNVGRMDVDGEQKAVGVGDDVPLAPVDALTGVEASRATSLGRWGTLTVDDGCRRTRLAAEPAACPPDQSCDDSLPPAGIAPKLDQRFQSSNHIMRPCRACTSRCERRDRG